jgi:hypothetical protein
MQTFKHKSISDYYCLLTHNSCEYLSSKSINYGSFTVILNEDWGQCPESEYLRVRDQAMHFFNEMRPKVIGASKYLNETSNPLTAE